jgi:hypothetical protein
VFIVLREFKTTALEWLCRNLILAFFLWSLQKLSSSIQLIFPLGAEKISMIYVPFMLRMEKDDESRILCFYLRIYSETNASCLWYKANTKFWKPHKFSRLRMLGWGFLYHLLYELENEIVHYICHDDRLIISETVPRRKAKERWDRENSLQKSDFNLYLKGSGAQPFLW